MGNTRWQVAAAVMAAAMILTRPNCLVGGKANPQPGEAVGEVPAADPDLKDLRFGAFDEKKVKALAASQGGSDRLKSLLIKRHEAARSAIQDSFKSYLTGKNQVGSLLGPSQRLLKSELEMCVKKEDQVAAWENHLQLLKEVHKTVQKQYQVGVIPLSDLQESAWMVLDAEVALERLRGG